MLFGFPIRPHDYKMRNFMRAAWMRQALLQYAEERNTIFPEHNGSFPKRLTELNLNAIPLEACRFHDLDTSQEYNWLYYSGYNQQSPPHTILLASPRMATGNKRIAVFCDGEVRLMDENAFVDLLSEQINK